jgi:hypothetical protein
MIAPGEFLAWRKSFARRNLLHGDADQWSRDIFVTSASSLLSVGLFAGGYHWSGGFARLNVALVFIILLFCLFCLFASHSALLSLLLYLSAFADRLLLYCFAFFSALLATVSVLFISCFLILCFSADLLLLLAPLILKPFEKRTKLTSAKEIYSLFILHRTQGETMIIKHSST